MTKAWNRALKSSGISYIICSENHEYMRGKKFELSIMIKNYTILI